MLRHFDAQLEFTADKHRLTDNRVRHNADAVFTRVDQHLLGPDRGDGAFGQVIRHIDRPAEQMASARLSAPEREEIVAADEGGDMPTCPVGGNDIMSKIYALLGVENKAGTGKKRVATLKCAGCDLAPIATYDGLRIDPCIPTSWPGFTAKRTFRGKALDIEVQNPSGMSRGVK